MMLCGLLVLCALFEVACCDYKCACNYITEREVYSMSSNDSSIVGHMYEFDCKPIVTESANWVTLAFEHQLGYVETGEMLKKQTCQGDYPDADKITNSSTTTTATLDINTTLSNSYTIVAIVPSASPAVQTTNIESTLTPSATTSNTVAGSIRPTTSSAPTVTSTANTTTQTSATPSVTSIARTATQTSTTPTVTSIARTTTQTSTTPTVTSIARTTTQTSTTPTVTSTARTTTQTSTTPTVTSTARTTAQTVTTIQVTRSALHECELLTHQSNTVFAYSNNCYELVTQHKTFKVAEDDCVRKGGHLAHINNDQEQQFLTSNVKQHYQGDHYIWIGLHDTTHEEHFEWLSGEPVSYTHWFSGRKNFLLHGVEDCVALKLVDFFHGNDGTWDDLPCNIAHAYICQFDLQSVPHIIG